jgi:hypothetical protein
VTLGCDSLECDTQQRKKREKRGEKHHERALEGAGVLEWLYIRALSAITKLRNVNIRAPN